MSENRGVGTHREGKEPLEEHALSGIGTHREGKEPLEDNASSGIGTRREGKAPEILTTEEPRIEVELGSLLFSGLPTKVGDKMVFFFFEVLVTQGDVTRGRLLIPVEAALQYFSSLADHQIYKEKIRMQRILDPARITDWLMFLTYDIPQALVSSTSSDVPIVEWLIDSGASDHSTGDSSKLHNLRPYKGNNKLMVAAGDLLPITHIGDATINLGHRTILLKNVLLVPEIKNNLLSVCRFTSDYPFNFEFSTTSFMIKDRTTKRVIASGRRRGDLYPLKTFKEGYFSNRFCEVAEDIWHSRLIIHEVKPDNFLFQLPLTNRDIKLGSLFISPEEVRNHFRVVGIPAETHQMEMLYFTDDRNGQWCMEIEFFQGPFLLRMEAFIDEHNLGVGDMIRFYKADQPLHSRHFLIGFVKGCGDPTQSGTAAINDCTDRSGDSEGDGGGGAVIGGNGQGDDGGGSRSGGRKWWNFSFGGCCVGMKSNARTEDS